jgi:hypothetical protein
MAKPGASEGEEISPSAETVDPIVASTEPVEHETESTGAFREPHSETPEGFSSHEETSPVDAHEPETVSAPPPVRESRRDDRREQRQPQREPLPPPSQRKWVKPADFRPAAPTAITQAVEHAMFIATALKDLHDQMDEVLELVEIAERQKIADERELEELRRALRRIQPPRQQLPSPRGPRRDYREQPRRDEPRQLQPPREQPETHKEPPPEAESQQAD